MLNEFLACLRDQVNKGIYVWGGNGENLLAMGDPFAWIKRHESISANADRDMTLFEVRVAQGVAPIQAFDCSGLVYWAQKKAGVGYGDMTANGYFKECKAVEQMKPGTLVFHHNGIKCVHVGVYMGDDTVIECKGRDVGVVETRYSKNGKYWNRSGWLKKLKEDPAPITPTKVKMTGTLCVRAEGSKQGKLIGYARKGNTYPLCGQAGSGWYRIEYKPGAYGYISNATKYTVLV